MTTVYATVNLQLAGGTSYNGDYMEEIGSYHTSAGDFNLTSLPQGYSENGDTAGYYGSRWRTGAYSAYYGLDGYATYVPSVAYVVIE